MHRSIHNRVGSAKWGARLVALALLGSAALVPAAAIAGPQEDYAAVEHDYEQWLLRESPEYATALGVRTWDDQLSDPSIAAMDRRAAAAAALMARLDAIPAAALDTATRTNQAIMHRQLAAQVEGNRFGQRMMLFSTYYSWHQGFAGMAENLPFANARDYRSYLTRIAQYPRVNDISIDITRQAVAQAYVLPCSVLGNFSRSITGLIATDPTQSRIYEPFTRTRPLDISEPDWAAMQAEARNIITTQINPAFDKLNRFFVDEYLPHCAASDSVSAQPGGAAYYAFRVGQETTTNMTPQQVHDLGLAEVARIRAEMENLARASGYADRAAMIAAMRANPANFVTDPEELMRRTARITRRIDGLLPRYFDLLPRTPYTIREIPAETAEQTTTAYYSGGNMAAGIAGTYYVNTSKLDQRPLWEIPALSLHESVPGHHLQIALQQELSIPMWRRNFTGFTAFTEGWGLYSEHLGIEMGMYDSPETNMGRLSYEMWRACRLVVDTGIHALGWDKARAVAFMRDNSALSDANIDAEVNRYISWPGQALGYKVGELRILALRAEAERALGNRFDVRRFHHAVLGQGSVPLDVLEMQIRDWIAAEQARPAP